MSAKISEFSDDEIRAEFARRGLSVSPTTETPVERVKLRARSVVAGRRRIGRAADPDTLKIRLLGTVDSESLTLAEMADGSILVDKTPEKTVIECDTGLLVIEVAKSGRESTYRAGVTQNIPDDPIRWESDVKHVRASVVLGQRAEILGYVHVVQVAGKQRKYRSNA